MKKRYSILLFVFGMVLIGFLVPDRRMIPVAGAVDAYWNKKSFWYEPWGVSSVHKGIDIFAERGTHIVASSDLLLLYKGQIKLGGNVIIGLGPKWRLHYFAHMETMQTGLGFFAVRGEKLGTVGDSGNAKGKSLHLHFSILSLLPLPWRMNSSTEGYKKSVLPQSYRLF